MVFTWRGNDLCENMVTFHPYHVDDKNSSMGSCDMFTSMNAYATWWYTVVGRVSLVGELEQSCGYLPIVSKDIQGG